MEIIQFYIEIYIVRKKKLIIIMKQVLIIENSNNKLSLNESTAVDGSKEYVMGGIFTEFGKRNRNDRLYEAQSFLPHLNELNERMSGLPGVVYGEFDHPDNFDISLTKISHVITKAEYVKESNAIMGEIKLLNTRYGKEAKAIVDDGFPIFVSSRAAGVTEANGTVNLKKLFTYDAVADPGFATAKMEMKGSLNESLGFTNESNFRIFDMTNESDANNFINMNNSDEMVSKKHMLEYSKYVTQEIEKMQKQIESVVKGETANPDFEKMQKMVDEYENMKHVQEKLVGYINYMSGNLKHVLIENKKLKANQGKIIEHSNHLADEININSANNEMIAEHILNHQEALNVINEDVASLIEHSDHVVEHMNNIINYSDYITENLVGNMEFTDFLSENLDASIAHTDHLADHIEANVQMSNYLAEHTETLIEYADHITENVSDNIEYIDYIAENVDKNIEHTNYITEKLNKKYSKLNSINENENFEDEEEENDDYFMNASEFGKEYDSEMEEMPISNETPGMENEEEMEMEMEEETSDADDTISCTRDEEGNLIPANTEEETEEFNNEEELEEAPINDDETAINTVEDEEEMEDLLETDPMLAGISAGNTVKIDGTNETATVISVSNEGAVVEMTSTGEQELKQISDLSPIGEDEEEISLTDTVQDLIEEAKKREASQDVDPHFFTFLSENQKTDFKALSQEDQEKIKVTINESDGYFCQADVLKLMHKALSIETETIEERLIKAMPEDVQPIWEQLDAKVKTGIFAQARLHNLSTPSLLESFWRTRKALKDNTNMLNESKKMIGDVTIEETELSEDVINMFKNKFDKLK